MFENVLRVFEVALDALGIEGDPSFLLIVSVLTFARFASFSFTIPAFGIGVRSNSGKLAISMVLTAITVPISISQANVAEGLGGALFFALLVKEIAVGFCFGFLIGLFFEAIRAAGFLIERYIGLDAPDLSTTSDRSMIGNFKLMLAALLFFVTGAYAPVFGAAAESVVSIPVTSFSTFPQQVTWLPIVIETGFAFFVISIGLALPVLFVLMTADIVTAIVQKTSPGLGHLAVRAPLRPLLAIVALAVFLQVLVIRFESVFSESIRALGRAIGLFG